MDKTQAEEYVKCRKDQIYFIKKYGKIRHPTKGLLTFELWDFQEETLQSFLNQSYNIIVGNILYNNQFKRNVAL